MWPLSVKDGVIVDASGKRFPLRAVNWYGASDANHCVGGLDVPHRLLLTAKKKPRNLQCTNIQILSSCASNTYDPRSFSFIPLRTGLYKFVPRRTIESRANFAGRKARRERRRSSRAMLFLHGVRQFLWSQNM